MKVLFEDEYHMVLFLFQDYISGIDFSSKTDLEAYFKKIFPKLSVYYDVHFDGFLDITIYTDGDYGAIIEIEKDTFDYPYASNSSVEMSIHIVKNGCILYEVCDPFLVPIHFLKKHHLYCYRNHYYIELQSSVEKKDFFPLLEQSQVVYGNITDYIVHYGQELKL